MPCNLNLARAEMAVGYVESEMRWPSGNKLEDWEHRSAHGDEFWPPLAADLEAKTNEMRNAFRRFEASNLIWHGLENPQDNVDCYLFKADCALQFGVGMCDELAAIAFKWLVMIRKVPCSVSYYNLTHGKN